MDSVIIDLEYAIQQAKRGDLERCVDGLGRAVESIGQLRKAEDGGMCEHCPCNGERCIVCGHVGELSPP